MSSGYILPPAVTIEQACPSSTGLTIIDATPRQNMDAQNAAMLDVMQVQPEDLEWVNDGRELFEKDEGDATPDHIGEQPRNG